VITVATSEDASVRSAAIEMLNATNWAGGGAVTHVGLDLLGGNGLMKIIEDDEDGM